MIESEAIGLIKDLGFPIVAYLLMFFHGFKVIEKNTAAIESLSKVIETKLRRK
jgi:hypothetical protein